MSSESTKKMVGILMLIIVSMVILSIASSQDTISASQLIKNTREFDLGEKIIIYELPEFLTEDQIAVMEQYATLEFFQDDLPPEFVEVAENQGQRNLLAEQEATPQQTEDLEELAITTKQENQSETISGVTTSELTASRTSLGLIESAVQENIHQRGAIVKIAGKIEKNLTLAPYFFNVNITCCGMDSFRLKSAMETDSQGNWIVKFATNQKFPLGDWTVTISTIGDSKKIIKHQYQFKLVG